MTKKTNGITINYAASANSATFSGALQSTLTSTLPTSSVLWNGLNTIPAVYTQYNGIDISKNFIGWDKQLENLELLGERIIKNSGTFPPYNIFPEDENTILVELAVAGFSKKDISIKQEKNALLIEGSIEEDKEKEKKYSYKGIATRSFTRAFALAEYVEVESAAFKDGILTIKLVRNLPEEEQARQITIK